MLWGGHRWGEPFWDTSVGKGRPGWHIECSVIALKHLGTSAAEANLRGLARRVALMAAGESLGGRGSAARKILERGSTASEQAAEALRKVQVMTLLDALGRPDDSSEYNRH